MLSLRYGPVIATVCVLVATATTRKAFAAPPEDLKPAGVYLTRATEPLQSDACRTAALDAEKAKDWAKALTAWERVIDRCISTPDQLIEARAHIKDLRPRVSRNTNPEKAHAWTVLAVIFRRLDFSWTDADGKVNEVHKTVTAEDEAKIRSSLKAFSSHVMKYSSGMLRLDIDIHVIDDPLTKLAGDKDGRPPFTPAPHIVKPYIETLLKARDYDTVIAYVKFNSDQGPDLSAPFTAATYGSLSDFNGAGFTMVPWRTNYPYPGETNGEMELHEWLHQIQSMFIDVLKYPPLLTANPDGGRAEGDNRPGGDETYVRPKGTTTWIYFYQHIVEEHYTRQMWSEATMRPPKDAPRPGAMLKP